MLSGVADRDAYANLLLPSVLRQRNLAGRDAALATELAYGTLRGQGTYDAILAVCSARGLSQIDPPVHRVLRLGAHQLLATRIRAHAAVDTSVNLARAVAGPRTAGFVNAVLRKVATRDLAAWLDIVAPPRSVRPGRPPGRPAQPPGLDRGRAARRARRRTATVTWPKPNGPWPRTAPGPG